MVLDFARHHVIDSAAWDHEPAVAVSEFAVHVHQHATSAHVLEGFLSGQRMKCLSAHERSQKSVLVLRSEMTSAPMAALPEKSTQTAGIFSAKDRPLAWA